MYDQVYKLFSEYKLKRLDYAGLQISVTSDNTYIGIFANQMKFAGKTYDIQWYTMDQFIEHMDGVLNITTQERVRTMAITSKELIEQAKEEGDFWGEFAIAAFRVNIPFRILFTAAGKLGKAMGYIDTDSNDAFKQAFINRIELYKSVNEDVPQIKSPNRTQLL